MWVTMCSASRHNGHTAWNQMARMMLPITKGRPTPAAGNTQFCSTEFSGSSSSSAGAVRGFASKPFRNRWPRRLKGVVGQAIRSAPPPKLPKRALEHYVATLRAQGNAGAKQVLEKRRRAAEDEKSLVAKDKEPWELTSEEKTALMDRYLPDEQLDTQAARKRTHKWLWRWMRKRDWKRHDACLEQLRNRQVPFDEITYNLAIFGALLHPRREDEVALELLDEMASDGKFHPALLRLQRGFVESYFELKEVDATPSQPNLTRVAKTFWFVSVGFKRRRIKELRARLAQAAAEQRRLTMQMDPGIGIPAPVAANGVGALGPGGDVPVAEEAEVFEVSRGGSLYASGDHNLVRFPARRPRQVKNVHRGSGAPRQKAHRWRH